MTPLGLLILACNALLVVVGTLLMRYGGKDLDFGQGLLGILHHGRLWLGGIVLCWLAGMVYAVILTRFKVIDSYMTYVVFTNIFLLFGAYFILREPLSLQKIGGASLALMGVLLMARG